MLMPGRYVSDTSTQCETVTQTKWVTQHEVFCYYVNTWPSVSVYGVVSTNTSSGLLEATMANTGYGLSFDMAVVPGLEQQFELEVANISGSAVLYLMEENDWSFVNIAGVAVDRSGILKLNVKPTGATIKVGVYCTIPSVAIALQKVCQEAGAETGKFVGGCV